MTFGLKNAGATYQRAMNFIFHEFIGKLVEIYIDDVVFKSGDFIKHLADLRKVLECTRKQGLKMNPNNLQRNRIRVVQIKAVGYQIGSINCGKASLLQRISEH